MSAEQQRDERGRFASSGADKGLHAQAIHNLPRPSPPTNKGVTNTVKERQAILAAQDARYGKRNVYHG
jgi:hypothetical protein